MIREIFPEKHSIMQYLRDFSRSFAASREVKVSQSVMIETFDN